MKKRFERIREIHNEMDCLKHERPRLLQGVSVSFMPDVVTAGGQYENGNKTAPIYQAFKIQGFRETERQFQSEPLKDCAR